MELKYNDKELSLYLAGMEFRGRNLTPLLLRLGALGKQAVEENFEQQGRPRWQGLSEVTKRMRAKKGYTGPILQVTGDLRDSVTISPPGLDSIDIGSNLEYAAIHQYGGRAGRGRKVNIPDRPFIHLEADDEEEMAETSMLFLTTGF